MSIPPLCLSYISVEVVVNIVQHKASEASKFDDGVPMRQHATQQLHEHACTPFASVVAVCPSSRFYAKLLIMQSVHL